MSEFYSLDKGFIDNLDRWGSVCMPLRKMQFYSKSQEKFDFFNNMRERDKNQSSKLITEYFPKAKFIGDDSKDTTKRFYFCVFKSTSPGINLSPKVQTKRGRPPTLPELATELLREKFQSSAEEEIEQ